MLLVWINNKDRILRLPARMCTSLSLTGNSYDQFQRVVNNGRTSRAHITDAILRDFRDEQVLDVNLPTAVQFIHILWPNSAAEPLQMETPGELKLVPGVLAAARRQMCMGDQKYEFRINNVIGVFSFLV